ncbi:glycosyltransferase [Pedobacter sp. SD-b]|uniref:Glycosyltransferase n=1 Tax=Pedobacter segetis TaxID=2793069 RepID=A0ABS1BGW9_9SPHI|nr:glycosyltransferase [Pedobacter segetis]MBK0382117.1 glycosyltransferase [Pedobacter segetis]
MIKIIFWVLISLIAYTYLIYPYLLKILAKSKKPITPNFYQPMVSIVIPAYNEALLIESKIDSICTGNYPLNKIEIIVYSDGSTDATKDIVLKTIEKYPFIRFYEKTDRNGKAFVVNQLVKLAKYDIVFLTDANIIFAADTINNNVKNYKNDKIGLVGSYVINQSQIDKNHTIQEESYVSWENEIKYNEGLIWGCTIAPFGACLSFRKKLFGPIPKNFLVDDFFIAATVSKNKYQCIIEKSSVCYEKPNGLLALEMKRRKRISCGNYQNLKHFFGLFINIFTPLGFCFWSHKGIRWLVPFFFVFLFMANFYLYQNGTIYQLGFFFQLFFYCTPLTYQLTKPIKPLNKIIKFAHYFLMMNFSLLVGFCQYVKGVKVGYWEISQRVK